MSFGILAAILCVFSTALVVSILFRKLNLSVILGYLLVGVIVGPHGLQLIPDSEYIPKLADFGIVFLMFTVGLEFSIPKLLALRKEVFLVGGLQVLFCVLISIGMGLLIGMGTLPSLVIGSIVAISSTALVVKQLNDQFELQSRHGLNAIGILLFQDVAVIPLIILITSFGGITEHHLSSVLLWAMLKGAAAILIIFALGRWLLRPLFRSISKTHSIELFTLCVLVVSVAASWITEILGLSYAFGAFLAGVMLAETEFRHQIEVEIRPFRDILLALFFISVGMLTNFHGWVDIWPWILLLLSALIVGKMLLIIILGRLVGNTYQNAARTGIVLAQGGEFGFAILNLAMDNKIFPASYQQVILAALLISIAIAPVLIRFNKQIAGFFTAKTKKLSETASQSEIIQHAKKLHNHVIICGYGRVGQHIARMLDKVHFPYVGIDSDADLVQRASLAGDEVIYGDLSHPEILEKAGVNHAKVVILCLSDHRSTLQSLSMIKQHFPKLPVLVRCRDKSELKQIKKIGATNVFAETFEVSLTLSNHLLHLIKLPRDKIAEIIQDVRNTDYDELQKVFVGALSEESDQFEESLHEQLRPIVITESAFAVDHKLNELNLHDLGVEVISLRRGHEKQVKPHGNIKILANDILVLFGTLNHLEAAENYLLEGGND